MQKNRQTLQGKTAVTVFIKNRGYGFDTVPVAAITVGVQSET
jgi:hypothetical protein